MAELLTDAQAPDSVLPGSEFIFEAVKQAAVPSNPGSTVFVAAPGTYGPTNEITDVADYRKGRLTFGPNDSPLTRALLGAFLGEGIPGRGGAGAVKAYRLAAASAAKATLTLQNTTPADALTLVAKQPGTDANAWTGETRPGVEVGTTDLILRGQGVTETYTFPTTNLASLVADIASSSALADPLPPLVDGVGLATITDNFAGGADGTAYTAGDYTAMLDAIEFEDFGVFAAVGLTDPAIVAALIAWKNDVKARGKRVRLVLGGPAAELFAAHKARAQALNDEDVIAFGTGSIGDSTLTADGSEVVISTADGTARVAGAWARRGERLDLVNVRFAGWRIIGGATRAQATIAASSGMSLLTRDGARDAPVKIGLGVTTYSANTPEKPFAIYSNAKFIATMHGLEHDLTQDQEGGGDTDELIDGRGVTDKSRDLVKGRAQAVVKARVDQGILQPGSGVEYDPDRPPVAGDTVVGLLYTANFVPGLRGIRNRIVVGV